MPHVVIDLIGNMLLGMTYFIQYCREKHAVSFEAFGGRLFAGGALLLRFRGESVANRAPRHKHATCAGMRTHFTTTPGAAYTARAGLAADTQQLALAARPHWDALALAWLNFHAPRSRSKLNTSHCRFLLCDAALPPPPC